MKIKLFKIYIDINIILILIILISIFSKIVRNIFYVYFECYFFIIFHELSHIFIASILGYKCENISFSICGMSANICIKNVYKDILILMAGPLSNFILAILFWQNSFIFKINILLGIINLLPIYPLDGYRIIKILNLDSRYLEIIIYIILIFLAIILKKIQLFVFIAYIIWININCKNKYTFSC